MATAGEPVKQARLPLALAALLVAVAGAGLALSRHGDHPPVTTADAAVTGQLWVLASKDVPAFLHRHGVELDAVPEPTGTTVVGHASWTAHAGPDDERFTLLLGDRNGGAGVIRQVIGPAGGDVSLGSGSMWNHTVRSHDWLRGDRSIENPTGSVTDYGTFASVRTTVAKDVWFLADVLDVTGATRGEQPLPTADPRPVLGVALSSGDRVWWVEQLTSA